MRKYVSVALCCTLLLSGKTSLAIDTSLLDRLAQEKIIRDGKSPENRAVADRQLGDVQAQRAAPAAELVKGRADLAAGRSGDATVDMDVGEPKFRIDDSNKHIGNLQIVNLPLIDQISETRLPENSSFELAAPQVTETPARADAREGYRLFVINESASTDVRASYALGAWYAESAPQETRKFASIGKKLNAEAFSQGFRDKLEARLQLPQEILTSELADTRRLLDTAMQSKNEKESAALMDAAAREEGAVQMPDGVVYRIVNKGAAPAVTAQNEILFHLEEKLSTNELLVQESRSGLVKDLPLLFQRIITQLGLGGSAKILTPITQADAMSDIPPGIVSIISIKITGVK